MGETATASSLMRSISHPIFASCELKEGDPLRALTTSVSFGRFLTEPLDWERWSSFSHNRILEDVKKYSRPGAVAEKKAFFEAHYKKTTSLKAAANSPEKENKAPVLISDNTRENESNEDVCQVDVVSPSANLVFSEFGLVDDNGQTPGFSQICHVEQEKKSTENKKTQIKDAATHKQTKPETFPSKFQSPRKASIPAIRVKKAAKDVMEKTRSALQSIHMSMNFSPSRNKNESSNTMNKPPKHNLTRVKKNSQVVPRPENKMSETVFLKSFSSKNSEAKKPIPATVPSSFCFRSEERAEKRKQFFQKLEEKGNINETKIIKLQPKLKEKARNDNKRLRSSTVLEAKPSTSEKKVPSKVLPTQCCSPMLVRKPKNFIEINKKKLSSSMASLPTKK